MDTESTAPGDRGQASLPAGGKVSNGNAQSISRPSGPRHVSEILPQVIWKLIVTREAERAQVQP